MFKTIEGAADCEIRSVIRFLIARNVLPSEIRHQICQVYGDNALSDGMVSTMCNFFTCYSAVFLQDLEHTFHTLVISRRSGSFSMLNLPSRKRWAQREIMLRSTVSTPHTSISELDLRWSFPAERFNFDVRALIVISHGTWDTNSRHFNALSFPSAHTSRDKLHCTSCQKFSSTTAEMAGKIVIYLRSVANVCISFEITLVDSQHSS